MKEQGNHHSPYVITFLIKIAFMSLHACYKVPTIYCTHLHSVGEFRPFYVTLI